MSIGFDATEDARRFFRTEQGVVLVTREMLEKLAAEEAPGEAGA
jgi:glucose-1-phosphate adenylyltransferase